MANTTRPTRSQSYFPVKIPLYSLSGGVGRQIPSKKMPNEVEESINFTCTTEYSTDKRNGTKYVSTLLPLSDDSDIRYHWMEAGNLVSYIFLIQQDSSADSTNFLNVYKVTLDTDDVATVTAMTVDSTIETAIYDYLCKDAAELKFVNIGSALLVLNPEVSAGFTSTQEDGDNKLKDLDGIATSTLDVKGDDIQYLTSLSVHRGHEAEVWIESADYVWGQKVIDTNDPVYTTDSTSDTNPWGEWRGYSWDENPTRNSGGHLVIDFNTQVLALAHGDTGKVASYQNARYGCQLTISGLDAAGESQSRNYVWASPWDATEAASGDYDTGEEWHVYHDVKIKRAKSVCVNPLQLWTNATVDIDFSSEGILVDEFITLIDGYGASKTYTAKTAEDLTSNQFIHTGTPAEIIASLKACIEHEDGHGGSITVSSVSDVATLRQSVFGADGNRAISSDFTSVTVASAFTGGGTGGSYTEGQLGSGYADADSLAAAILSSEGHTTAIFEVLSNQRSFTDSTPYPGRVLIRAREAGLATNTKIWKNNYIAVNTDSAIKNEDYNLDSYAASDLPSSLTGGVEDGDESIQDTFNPKWDTSETGVADYWSTFSQADAMYGIWQVKKYLPAEELPGPTNELLSENTQGSTVSPHLDLVRWERVVNQSDDLTTGTDICNVEPSWFIPVEEYSYPDPLAPHLGQSVSKLSDLKFPPTAEDLVSYNGTANVQTTLHALYPNDSQAGSEGFGKIIHLSQSYLDHTPGWYRIINKEEAPYIKKIRTPGIRAVIDQRRMPMMIYLSDAATNTWSARMVDWDHRTSGDKDTNKGPGLFFNPSTEEPQESKINTMAFYRDRLFLANNETVIASRSGNWDNFWLADPENVIDSDPLDLMVSTNTYTPIKNLVPFKDFLFVGTSGSTQYELMGSQNVISPLTAVFSPTAFYPMLNNVDPLPMDNNLFFFSKQKLYIYFGQKKTAVEQAFEVSKHIPGYLPNEIKSLTGSSHSSMLFALEKDTTPSSTSASKIFVYKNQIAGDQVIQNAFFKWTMGSIATEKHSLRYLHTWGKNLYCISKNYKEGSPTLVLSRLPLDREEENIPRLDYLRDISGDTLTPVYDSSTNLTTITVTWGVPFVDIIITTEGEVLDLTKTDTDGLTYTTPGNLVSALTTEHKWAGVNFPSSIEFSTVYLRDEANNIAPGSLNLRYCVLQTYNSKKFSVDVEVRNRNKNTYEFDQEISDSREDNDWIGSSVLTGRIKEHQVRFPILGFNNDVQITISSDNPHPLNIASLQFTGKFKGITRFHNS